MRETWAHYLHICDTLEMAQEFGLSINPRVAAASDGDQSLSVNAYNAKNFEDVIADWLPITFAVNSLNRAMGQPDLYPFVVTAPVVRKLDYIRQLVNPDGGTKQKGAMATVRHRLQQTLSGLRRQAEPR